VLGPVHEAVHQVVCHVQFIALTLINIIMEVPERPALPVKIFVESINSYTFFIFMINEESFEVK